MVRTRRGHRSRPKGQTSAPARDGAGTSRATTGYSPAQDTKALGGPRLPRGPRTSGPGESLCSRSEPSPPPAAQSSSPQLSLASRIRRPMFSCDPIPGNVNCLAKDFHGESHYDIPTLAADPRFRDSMWLV